MNTKETLRKKYLTARQALPAGYRKISSRVIISHVLTLVSEGKTVAGYNAIKGEMNISSLLKVLAERDHTLCLPDIEGDALVFRQWKPGQALIKGKFGVDVPVENAAVIVPDVLLVPLVAFDAAGHRLGYGAGYYDRAIHALRQKNKELRAIGMAFSSQQVGNIPAESTDEKLDAIITEQGIVVKLW